MDKEIKFDILYLIACIISLIVVTCNLEPFEWQHDPLAIITSVALVLSVIKFLFDISRKDNNYGNAQQ